MANASENWSQNRSFKSKVHIFNKFFIKEDTYILAFSFQILMLSGIGPKAELEKHGIPIIKELQVGYNLQDHVNVAVHMVFNESIDVQPEE